MEVITPTPQWVIVVSALVYIAAFAFLAFIGGSVLNSIRKERKEKNK